MKFNFSGNIDFLPEIEVPSFSRKLEFINETKILGVILTNNQKWDSNTHYWCTKAYKKLWVLRRLRSLNLPESFLVDVHVKEYVLSWNLLFLHDIVGLYANKEKS